MRKFAVAFVAALVLATAGTASASGPAPPGKDVFEIDCQGLGTITVSAQRSENSSGAVQIVGEQGHLLGATFEFTFFDVTTNTVVFSESDAVGQGHAHSKQPTSTCTVVFFEGPAAELPLEEGEELPSEVAPTDIVRLFLTVEVVVKP
jgi:hypothetical protein